MTLAQVEQALADARLLLEAPRLSAANLADSRWNGLSPALHRWLTLGMDRQKRKEQWKKLAKDEAEQVQWRDMLGRRDAHKASLLRFLRPSWYSDGRLLKANLLAPELPPIEQQLVLLQQLISSADLRRKIEEEASSFSNLFETYWTGPDSDWTLLRRYAEAAVAIRQLVLKESIPSSVARKAVESDDRAALGNLVSELQESLTRLNAFWKQWLETIASTGEAWLGSDFKQVQLAGICERLSALPATIERLQDWLDLRALVSQCSRGPLESFIRWACSKEGLPARGRLAATFKRHFYRLWIDRAMAERPTLLNFRGDEHDASVKRFGTLDRNWLTASKDRLRALIAQARPNIGHMAHKQSKLGILQAEIRKKARHMPLRKLLSSVGDVIQLIKPCFMMSPLSVAQYLAPGCIEFDVVIFDEASQIEPADAYGAIARGRQVLLVGDENQLPPTNFFVKADAEEANEDEAVADVRVADLESVLSLGVVRFANRSSLRWHYRSRHASLIQFSNEKFYDGRLRVFPSPHTDCSETGVSFRFVESAIYKRGAGRYNPVEAATVALAVIDHARTHPGLSLGVGTLNAPQQQAIQDEIERLRRESPGEAVEEFLDDEAKEPFFVKNLESIQGDERDVIFLSVGYGPDGTGRPISSNFGALNRDGGWRRLNVLVTRARRRCVVFSSFRADDLQLAAATPLGVVALKEYLYLAERGQMINAAAPGGDHDSEFEAQVCRALRDRGWDTHAQIGCAGFAVDLAVVDPERPGRYLLGIECDGATYHSSPTARDRDRLRQEVLEGLGWKIHRIWSTDWFHRPQFVLDKLLNRLEVLRRDPSRFTTPEAPPAAPTPRVSDVPPAPPVQPIQASGPAMSESDDQPMADGVVEYERLPIRRRGDQARLLSMPTAKLADMIVELVNMEGPVHAEEIVRVVAEMFSTRTSIRSREACDRAIRAAATWGQIRRVGEFLWQKRDTQIRVRYRGNGCPVVKPELIAPEEYDAAVRLVLEKEFGLGKDSLAASAISAMGFRRRGTQLQTQIDGAIERLIKCGEIVSDHAGFLVLAAKH
jgi:very-short-patch-repair endonuclease